MHKISWLDYTKTILEKVSFDRKIFTKELLKGLSKLSKKEIAQLQNWCLATFSPALAYEAVMIIQDYLQSAPM